MCRPHPIDFAIVASCQTRTAHLLFAMHRNRVSAGWRTLSRARSAASRMTRPLHTLSGSSSRPDHYAAVVSRSSDGCSDTTRSKPGRPRRSQAGENVARLGGDYWKRSWAMPGIATLVQPIQTPSRIPMIRPENQTRAPIWYSPRPSFFLIQK